MSTACLLLWLCQLLNESLFLQKITTLLGIHTHIKYPCSYTFLSKLGSPEYKQIFSILCRHITYQNFDSLDSHLSHPTLLVKNK